MTIRLYFDEDSMDHRLVRALQARGMNVRTALDENMIDRADEEEVSRWYDSGKSTALFGWGTNASNSALILYQIS